jgi:Domain of unknown function (DUF6468)
MSWLPDYGLVFDAVICVLLITTIGYAVVLNRKLNLLRAARGEMEKLFADFASATGQAEGSLEALKQRSGDAGETLARNVNDACRLADEMAFLVKKGNEIADRLEVAVAASRKVNQPAAELRREAPQSPVVDKGLDRQIVESLGAGGSQGLGAGDGGAPRGIAKLAKRKLSNADSELMRALQAIR